MAEKEENMQDESVLSLLRMAKLAALDKTGQLSQSEQEELKTWLQQDPVHQEWWDELSRPGKLPSLLAEYDLANASAGEALQRFHREHFEGNEPVNAPVRTIRSYKRWWVAASVLLLLAAGGYFWLTGSSHKDQKPPLTKTMQDIAPGRDGAILTLADGKQVVLDSLGNGVVADQSGSTVVLSNGQLTYQAPAQPGNLTEEHVYNTTSTPPGRQFKIQLPDGTDVWLNTASSITYPTAFSGNERKVTITGEVYFEVVHNKAKPFLVDIGGKATVEVLGTHFNVNDYGDEGSINTTLLQGSVRMVHLQEIVLLKPGQQARLSDPGMKVISNPNLEMVMAWRNGLFSFHNAPLDMVLKQLARWYNVQIKYEQGVPDILFSGEIKRDLTLSQALEMLSEMGVRFRTEERTLIVMP